MTMKAFKTSLIALITIAVLVVFYLTIVDYCNIPVVLKNPAGEIVGCVTNESNWERIAADNPICQKALKGKYEVEWVKK
jgi:hypothetical protein